LVGSLARKRGLVRAFYTLVFIQTLGSVGLGAYYLYILWSNHDNVVADACNSLASPEDINSCIDGIHTLRIVSTVVLAISWVIEFCEC
jgi:hypothetical protein